MDRSGSAAQLGGQAVEAPQSGVAGHLTQRVGGVAASVIEATSRLQKIADRAFGSRPQEASKPSGSPEAGGEVGAAHAALDYVEQKLSDLHEQIDRLSQL